jgi:hypothetical protein
MEEQRVLNVLFTTKIHQKKKSWEDGIAAFTSSSGSKNRLRFILRSTESKMIYEGYYQTNEGFPCEDTEESKSVRI